MTLDELIADAEGKIRAAFQAGVLEGRALERRAMRERLFGGDVSEGELDLREPTPPQVEDARRKVLKRAPKGLTDKILAKVFEASPNGMLMEEAQEKAVALDERVSPKTVYNELYRKTEKYQKGVDGLWRQTSRGGNANWHSAHQGGTVQ